MPLTIRLATPDDTEQIREIYSPYCATPISFELEPPSIEEMRNRIHKVLDRHAWLVCEEADEVLGYAYASQHRERAAYGWSVDVSAYIQQGQRRRGLGRALYTCLFRLLVVQGYVNAYAGVTLPNPASVGLHEAMGFVRIGIYKHVGFKLGAWHDVAWFERSLQPLPAEPVRPKRVDEVRAMAEWADALNSGPR